MSAADASRDRAVLGALRRAATYRALAAAFAYPTHERLAALAGLVIAVAGDAPASMRDGLLRLAEAARPEEAAALAAQHVALFDGAVRCPPYEGAYGPAQLGGKAAQLADIAAFYEAFGLELTGDQRELPDHIAAELEFMGVLAIKEAWAIAGDDDEGVAVTRHAAAAFLEDHLGRWGAGLAARIGGAGSTFHETAAGLVAAWLEIEAPALEVAPTPLFPRDAHEGDGEPFTCPLAETGAHPPQPGAAAPLLLRQSMSSEP
jgi:DMSO reductase family type II enzyme chaperone